MRASSDGDLADDHRSSPITAAVSSIAAATAAGYRVGRLGAVDGAIARALAIVVHEGRGAPLVDRETLAHDLFPIVAALRQRPAALRAYLRRAGLGQRHDRAARRADARRDRRRMRSAALTARSTMTSESPFPTLDTAEEIARTVLDEFGLQPVELAVSDSYDLQPQDLGVVAYQVVL